MVNVDRVLAIRVGRAGDMVMLTPALKAILVKHPNADVHLLTSPDGRRVLQGFDERITAFLIYQRKGMGAVFARCRFPHEIARNGYSDIYCFETNTSFRRLFERSAARLHVLENGREPVPFAERCLGLVQRNAPSEQWMWLPMTEQGRQAARAMYAKAGIDESHFVIGLHPSFSGLQKFALRSRDARRRKTWPHAAFARLAGLLADYGRRRGVELRIVCDLLPEDRSLGEALRTESGGRVTLFSEPPDFERYKAALARMNLLVTPDTGPMHMAAALGTPLVALFAGRDPRDCGPYTAPERYTVLCAEDMPRPEQGLAAIPPEAVFEACRKFFPA